MDGEGIRRSHRSSIASGLSGSTGTQVSRVPTVKGIRMKTPWEIHRDKWKSCTRCPLHSTRRNVVLARGAIPCQVLFIGESPGQSEDVLGQPFVGPAGHLLNYIVDMALPPEMTRAFTNLVACIPIGEEGTKTAEPDPKCIEACEPRLDEFIRTCNPDLIVHVGALASKWHSQWRAAAGVPFVQVAHPAFILRLDIVQRPLAIKRSVITISDAVSCL